ncbi:antibiotic biosynthesis monooxygenase family protein [Wenyingzhuangia sp. IMCC45467]
MILEVAILNVKMGLNKSFEKDFELAEKYISSIEGYITHSIRKCIEKENQYILLVEWEKLENHTVGFRESKEYLKWKELLHHYYEPFPEVEHYKTMKNFS